MAGSDQKKSMLWRYNQHYFDDLCSPYDETHSVIQASHISQWITNNPVFQEVGWDPYPTSLRIVNWCKWSLLANDVPSNFWSSLESQARWLAKNLEWHLQGNHLFSNAKALIFAGTFLCGKEADRWRELGKKIVNEQLEEQILDDGANFELSPMYHAIFLEDLLDMINLASSNNQLFSSVDIQRWTKYVSPMLRWYSNMCHADGEVAYFNDSTKGIAPTFNEINNYAVMLNVSHDEAFVDPKLVFHKASGYAIVSSGKFNHIIDVGRIGAEYLPGHGHADILSFESSLNELRFIVNCGVSEYGYSSRRSFERSSAAHNCITINGESSSEVWSSFRVARRARPVGLLFTESNTDINIACSHDGWRRFDRGLSHKRKWSITQDGFTLVDEISGNYDVAISRIFFHPNVLVSDISDSGFIARAQCGALVFFQLKGCKFKIEYSEWADQFGKRIKNSCLSMQFNSNKIEVDVRLG